MKKITADYIFTLDSEPRQDAVIILDADGTILDITDLQPFEKVERYSGIICPGFVNTHCHLELSHLKGAISKKTGLVKFIQGVQKQRRKTSDQILKAIEEAEKEMVDAGIVAVGDISNTHHTIKQKQKGNLYYHTFVEAFGFSPGRAQAVFDERLELKDRFEQKGLSASITPHAMYSTSKELMELIVHYNRQGNSPVSIHIQESPEEDKFFINKSAGFVKLYDKMDQNITAFKPTGVSAMQSLLRRLDTDKPAQFVHNTFTQIEDIFMAKNYNEHIYWCLCPSANQYIEDTLPNVKLFKKLGLTITVGTDSLASNDKLSIFEELKLLAMSMGHHNIQDLLEWGSLNGSKMLGIDKRFGTIAKGKKPGLNLIQYVDLENLQLTENSQVLKLI